MLSSPAEWTIVMDCSLAFPKNIKLPLIPIPISYSYQSHQAAARILSRARNYEHIRPVLKELPVTF